MTFEEFEEILKNRLLQDAKAAMKDGFNSLSDEMKHKEFCRLLDENDKYINREKKLIKYLEDKIKKLKSKNKSNNFGLDIVSTKGRIMAYQDILERVKSGKYE